MTADFGSTALDRYIVGQYAYWAGDYDYAQRCYAIAANRDVTEAVHPTRQESDDALIENLAAPEDLLAYVANRRERRIAEKRYTFDNLVTSLPADAQDLVPQPLILSTARLRGAVWRLGAREFEMRAYVSAVKHGKHVLKRANEIAEERGVAERQATPAEPPEEPLRVTPVYRWEEPGNPFLTVVVTRMLFIEVGAFWSERRVPTSFAPIQERLQAVLDSLSQ
jgi:hypothetical protein